MGTTDPSTVWVGERPPVEANRRRAPGSGTLVAALVVAAMGVAGAGLWSTPAPQVGAAVPVAAHTSMQQTSPAGNLAGHGSEATLLPADAVDDLERNIAELEERHADAVENARKTVEHEHTTREQRDIANDQLTKADEEITRLKELGGDRPNRPHEPLCSFWKGCHELTPKQRQENQEWSEARERWPKAKLWAEDRKGFAYRRHEDWVQAHTDMSVALHESKKIAGWLKSTQAVLDAELTKRTAQDAARKAEADAAAEAAKNEGPATPDEDADADAATNKVPATPDEDAATDTSSDAPAPVEDGAGSDAADGNADPADSTAPAPAEPEAPANTPDLVVEPVPVVDTPPGAGNGDVPAE